MGTDYDAHFVYGIKITDDKLLAKINDDDFKLEKDFDIEWSGSAYSDDDYMSTFVCIKKSVKSAWLHDDPKCIKQKDIIAPTEWHDKLIAWANENDCSRPQIGWWLLLTERQTPEWWE